MENPTQPTSTETPMFAIGLTFREVSATQLRRARRWHPGFPNDGWTGADWSNAMCGEAGETANIVKKLRRLDFGLQQAAGDKREDLLAKLAMEIGDTFLYLDLLAQHYGLDTARCIAETFNRVSVREGFPERLPRPDAGPADVTRGHELSKFANDPRVAIDAWGASERDVTYRIPTRWIPSVPPSSGLDWSVFTPGDDVVVTYEQHGTVHGWVVDAENDADSPDKASRMTTWGAYASADVALSHVLGDPR